MKTKDRPGQLSRFWSSADLQAGIANCRRQFADLKVGATRISENKARMSMKTKDRPGQLSRFWSSADLQAGIASCRGQFADLKVGATPKLAQDTA
jgi:predicted DNA-binding protein with PD1-like motif